MCNSKPAESTNTDVVDQHDATINKSSGFHFLEIHTGTLGTLGILLGLAAIGALLIWYAYVRCQKARYGPGTPGYSGPAPHTPAAWNWGFQPALQPSAQAHDPLDYCRWQAGHGASAFPAYGISPYGPASFGTHRPSYAFDRFEDLGPGGSRGNDANSSAQSPRQSQSSRRGQGRSDRHIRNERSEYNDDTGL